MKRLYRSRKNKVFAGIIGGLGEYLEVDPTLLRLIWILVVVFTAIFPGVIAYFFAMMVIPKNGEYSHHKDHHHKGHDEHNH